MCRGVKGLSAMAQRLHKLGIQLLLELLDGVFILSLDMMGFRRRHEICSLNRTNPLSHLSCSYKPVEPREGEPTQPKKTWLLAPVL